MHHLCALGSGDENLLSRLERIPSGFSRWMALFRYPDNKNLLNKCCRTQTGPSSLEIIPNPKAALFQNCSARTGSSRHFGVRSGTVDHIPAKEGIGSCIPLCPGQRERPSQTAQCRTSTCNHELKKGRSMTLGRSLRVAVGAHDRTWLLSSTAAQNGGYTFALV